MDPSQFKSFSTSRGLVYSYYYSPAKPGKPTLLFAHGFPCTAYDWRFQVDFFEPLGYGLVVPDMLGYGGSSKPTDTECYRPSLLARDMDELLEEEGVSAAIAVGHDWGCVLASRLANCYPTRFIGFVFLAVWYMPPGSLGDLEKINVMLKSVLGYEVFGYWKFLADPNAAQFLSDHIDSFMSICFGEVESVKRLFMESSVLRNNLLADKRPPRAPYLSEDEWTKQRDLQAKSGFKGSLNWYKLQTSGVAADDDSKIPMHKSILTKPVFFAGATKDPICLPDFGTEVIRKNCMNATIKRYDAGHWIMLSHHKKLNNDLVKWIDQLTPSSPVRG